MAELIGSLGSLVIHIYQVSYIYIEDVSPYLTSVLLGISFVLLLILAHRNFTYWRRKGVNQKYTFPFRDDMTLKIYRKRTFGNMVTDIYNRFVMSRYVGFYQLHKPILMVKDPELIKFVCVNNHNSFQDHTHLVPRSCDPLWNKTIFSLRGKNWLRARSHVAPMFMERRLRSMFETTRSYAYNFTNSLVPINRRVFEVNTKELFAKCTTEIMAQSFYDLHNKSFKNVNSTFYTKLRESAQDFDTWQLIKILLNQTFPCLAKLLRPRIFSAKVSNFFSELTTKIIRHRNKFGIERQDLVSFLMNVRNRELDTYLLETIMDRDPGTKITDEYIDRVIQKLGIDLTEETIVAQAMTFFYFGYDVVSTVLCFVFYELAQNPAIQKRLIKDLDVVRAKHTKLLSSDLFKLPYLCKIISETLRKWPPFYFTERVCNRSITISKKFHYETNVRLSAGDTVWIPIWAIHRDPKYWWKPEIFNPERFDDAKPHHNMIGDFFLPFGVGPRSCIGIKLALMQIKIIVSEILAMFEIVPIKITPKEIELDHRTFHLTPKDDIWLGLKNRFL